MLHHVGQPSAASRGLSSDFTAAVVGSSHDVKEQTMSRWLAPACALIVLLCPELARAQMGGRMGGGGGRLGRGGESKPDKPRVVEQGKTEKKPRQ